VNGPVKLVAALGLVLALVLSLVLSLVACSRTPARPNVLVITIDTWRADRLSAAGFPRPVTPELDRLAAESLRFTHVSAPRAKTTPSIASLFTGLYPHEHGARDLLMPLAPTFPLLAERLRAAGWSTAAIVGNFVLRDDFAGLARGFDSWTEDLPDAAGVPPENVPQRSARSLTDGALVALGLRQPQPGDAAGPMRSAVRDGEPWFLWLHYMDPHGDYAAPPEHRIFERATPEWIPPAPPPAPDGLNRRWIAEYNVPAGARAADGRIDAARVRDQYDAEVHYADAEIGRLLSALRARGELENTLVVVTSDHGESLGEQDYWFEHGRNVSEATVRVPLIVRWPELLAGRLAGRPAPGVRGGDVSLCDVAPTILELLGLAALAPPEADTVVRGTSRLALWRTDDTAPHPVFSEKVDRDELQGAVQSKAVRIGDWKWIRRFAHVPGAAGGAAGRAAGQRLGAPEDALRRALRPGRRPARDAEPGGRPARPRADRAAASRAPAVRRGRRALSRAGRDPARAPQRARGRRRRDDADPEGARILTRWREQGCQTRSPAASDRRVPGARAGAEHNGRPPAWRSSCATDSMIDPAPPASAPSADRLPPVVSSSASAGRVLLDEYARWRRPATSTPLRIRSQHASSSRTTPCDTNARCSPGSPITATTLRD